MATALKERRTAAPPRVQDERQKQPVSDALHKIKPVTAEKTEQKVLTKEEQVEAAKKEISDATWNKRLHAAMMLGFSAVSAFMTAVTAAAIQNPAQYGIITQANMAATIIVFGAVVLLGVMLTLVIVEDYRKDANQLRGAESKLAKLQSG